ncbi:MAG: ribosome small subunit-dependent GTPase A [Leptolinea sp.]|nr:ribosome small subunit-dependent GTPase A [Leptolinea sp.]
MTENLLTGLVTRTQSGFAWVDTPSGVFTCRLRGKLKQHHSLSDILAVGDTVDISVGGMDEGMVEFVHPRNRVLSRQAPDARGLREQVLVANPDQVILVFACADPPPHVRMADRFLIGLEKHGIPARIVLNKKDIGDLPAIEAMFKHYKGLGFPVHYVSAKMNEGMEELRSILVGKLSVLAGPSGVGKTSLLNALQPGLGMQVREVSKSSSKGRHTTQVRELFPLDGGGWLADLPGIRSLGLWDIQPEELDGYFREIRDLVPYCQFNDCTHRTEPGCAVRKAAEEGKINPVRYDSYLRLRFGDE